MLSHTPEAARLELAWGVLGLWLLGVMSVTAILARDGDPLSWSVALARKLVRQELRAAPQCRKRGAGFGQRLGEAVQDGYQRHGSKQARDWPHKKREKPPGAPKIREATSAEAKRANRFRDKEEGE